MKPTDSTAAVQPTARAVEPQASGIEHAPATPLKGRSNSRALGKPVAIAASVAVLLALMLRHGPRKPRKSGSVLGTILKSVVGTALVTVVKQKLLPHRGGAKISLPLLSAE